MKPERKRKKEYIKPIEFNDGKVRVPRPLGFTYTLIANKNQDREIINQLRKKTIELYVNQNFTLNNKPTKIDELASYLGMNTQTVLREMNREIERITNFFDGKEGRQIARVRYEMAVKKSLEIQALVAQQTQTLMHIQGTKYVPFLTTEVNRSLANLITAQKPVHDLLKMLTEKQQINILIPSDGDSRTSGQHYISPEQAMKMITEKAESLLGNADAIAAKEVELGSLPDVLARNQDLTKIGVRIPAKVDKIYMPNNANSHNNRPDRVPNEVHDADDFIA